MAGGMGFRDFRDFNMAMLGKQGWRLLMNVDSLVSRVFKARYYPEGDFLTANLGNNPNYVWRSVWEARGLIRSGARWQVASGEKNKYM